MKKYNKARQQLVEMYTNCLEEGMLPWEKMCQTNEPKNAISGKKYSGMNNLLLSLITSLRGYSSNNWCTFSQMKKRNLKFNQDAKGKGVCIEYWSRYNIKNKKKYSFKEYEKIIKDNPELEKDFKLIIRCTTVYNVDLIENFPKKDIEQLSTKEQIVPSEFINDLINKLGVDYQEYGYDAYYLLSSDKVVIPPSNLFENQYAYNATQLHELAHSTGHPKRLNRNITGEFGSPEYAKEELRAEISSSFLMQKLNLEYDQKHLDNHKAYIQSWIQILKDKPQELFKAISDADKVVKYLEDISKEKNIEQDKNVITKEVKPIISEELFVKVNDIIRARNEEREDYEFER